MPLISWILKSPLTETDNLPQQEFLKVSLSHDLYHHRCLIADADNSDYRHIELCELLPVEPPTLNNR